MKLDVGRVGRRWDIEFRVKTSDNPGLELDGNSVAPESVLQGASDRRTPSTPAGVVFRQRPGPGHRLHRHTNPRYTDRARTQVVTVATDARRTPSRELDGVLWDHSPPVNVPTFVLAPWHNQGHSETHVTRNPSPPPCLDPER